MEITDVLALIATLSVAIRTFVEALFKPLLFTPLYVTYPSLKRYNEPFVVLLTAIIGTLAAYGMSFDVLAQIGMPVDSPLMAYLVTGAMLGFGSNIANEVIDTLMRLKGKPKLKTEDIIEIMGNINQILIEMGVLEPPAETGEGPLLDESDPPYKQPPVVAG